MHSFFRIGMWVHILGIGGVFMGNLALMLKELGWEISGSDGQLYPPMSDLLATARIAVQGYDPALLTEDIDCFVIGNSISRGNPLLEEILDRGLPYTSGPELLSREVLAGREVIAVAGTHGKTTTTSMLVHIFNRVGKDIGFLVGGSLQTASGTRGGKVGSDSVFVIEADEYDSAFCDKRAKFVHYRPRWAVLNNLEFDHADIYADLAAIETQFHHMVRLIPRNGTVIYPMRDKALQRVMARGVWSQSALLGKDWQLEKHAQGWQVTHNNSSVPLAWQVAGEHNARNALAAIAAAHCAGVDWQKATMALADFTNAARRIELLGNRSGVHYYTDFAHHPTAVAATLEAMRELANTGRLLVILHPASNTMKSKVHKNTLLPALKKADLLWLYQPNRQAYDLGENLAPHPGWQGSYIKATQLAQDLLARTRPGDLVVTLSNGDITGLHSALLE